jgi:hypothetical protein
VHGDPLGEGLGELAERAGVGQDPVAARQLDARRERPRAGDLQLHRGGRAAGAIEGVLEGVEVTLQQLDGPAVVGARLGGHPVAGGHLLDGKVHQQGGAAAEQVGAEPAVRQLGQVRQVGQFADHDAGRLGRVNPRHGADSGGRTGRPRVGAHAGVRWFARALTHAA